MSLTLERVKPNLNILDDTFDTRISELIVSSEEFVKDSIHNDVDLDDPAVEEVQLLWILGVFDERQTQYRNYNNAEISRLQMKYNRIARLKQRSDLNA